MTSKANKKVHRDIRNRVRENKRRVKQQFEDDCWHLLKLALIVIGVIVIGGMF